MKKICSKCGVEKAVSEFHKSKGGKYGVRGECKVCNRERRKKYYEENQKGNYVSTEETRAKGRELKRKWRDKNPNHYRDNKERIDFINKEWAKNNPEKIKAIQSKYQKNNKEKKREYEKDRYANDTLYKLKKTIKHNCWRVTDAVKQQKELRSLEYLGCSLEEFKTHIESLWLDGMTWENHGIDGWHIDHKIPLDYFVKNEDDPWKANHYSNLQPLWAEENFRKGNSI